MQAKKAFTTSFEIQKQIMTSHLFSRVKLTPSAKLVLQCIASFWNYKLGCAYPTQETIASCVGLNKSTVSLATDELKEQNLMQVTYRQKRCYYFFTSEFFNEIFKEPQKTKHHGLEFPNNNTLDFSNNEKSQTHTLENLNNIDCDFQNYNIVKEKEKINSSFSSLNISKDMSKVKNKANVLEGSFSKKKILKHGAKETPPLKSKGPPDAAKERESSLNNLPAFNLLKETPKEPPVESALAEGFIETANGIFSRASMIAAGDLNADGTIPQKFEETQEKPIDEREACLKTMAEIFIKNCSKIECYAQKIRMLKDKFDLHHL